MQKHSFTTHIGEHEVVIETGTLALQAGGSVTIRSGGTVVLATATAAQEPREGTDFFPLGVDYEERMYAAGKIPGSFFRREGRPSEAATLLCRLVDRPLRPLFPKGLRNDVHIVLTSLASDEEHFIDILSIVGASAALHLSDVPWGGPIGAVRIGYIDNELIANPTVSEMERSKLDLRMAGTTDAILMVEAGANEVSEEIMLRALKQGHEVMQEAIHLQNQMREDLGKKKREFPVFLIPEETKAAVQELVAPRIGQVLDTVTIKAERIEALATLKEEAVESLQESFDPQDIKDAFEEYFKAEMRGRILDRGRRIDGRDLTTIRPIACDVGFLARTHGTGLFTRGETQVMSILTLGTPRDEQMLDSLDTDDVKRYLHHYNFPPYSTGEAGMMRGPRRREIGHGALAERALVPVIPPEERFPYTIRVVSEVLSSNGSTSMASVCGSSLALMDAGVPISAPVAGVAMGLIMEGDRHAVLTDILGMEDHLGDMDFKVAGTQAGITALQMDLKLQGLPYDILEKALSQAREGRLFILDRMLETISEPRANLSPYAPRITVIHVDPEKIGAIIGPGGKTIRRIQEETEARIDVEDDGSVFIAATSGPAAEKAIEMIEDLTADVELGTIYTGRVVRTTDFGAFVEVLPGKDGLVHISQLADYRVPSVEDVVRVGDEVQVMVIGIDDQGKVRLSRSAVMEGLSLEEAQARDRASAGARGRSSRSGRYQSNDRRGGDRGPRRPPGR